MPVLARSILLTIIAILSSDALTFGFYWLLFQDVLLHDLVLTAIVTMAVAMPMSFVFLEQFDRLERRVEELRHASRTDHLTRLANRREFMTSVGDLLARGGDKQSAGALLFIDADRFKRINDSYGHAVGDTVLVALAGEINACIRREDIAARIGGEEFAIFLLDADEAQARRIAERIRVQVNGIGPRLGLSFSAVTVSIGVAMHGGGANLDSVLRAADRSLYVAKNKGRNMVVFDTGAASVA